MNCTSGCGAAGAEPPVEGVTPLDAPSAQPVQAGDGVGSTDLVPLPTVEGPEDVGPSPTPFPMPIIQRPPEDGASKSCRCAGEKAERKCCCCCRRRRDDERELHPMAPDDAFSTRPGLDLSQATPLTAGQGGGTILHETSSPPPLVPSDAIERRRALVPGLGNVAAARILDRREGLFESGSGSSFPPARKAPRTFAAPDSVASSFGIRDLSATAAPVVDQYIEPPERGPGCCCSETSERRSEAECCCCCECDGSGDGDGGEAPSLPPPDGSEIVPRDTAPTGSGEGPAGEIAPYSRRPAGPIYASGGGLHYQTPVGTIVGQDVCEVGEYGNYVSPEGNRYWGCPFNPGGVYGPTPAAAAAQGMMFFPTQRYADDPAGSYLGGTYVGGLWVASPSGYVMPPGGYGDSLSAYTPAEPPPSTQPRDLGKSKYPLVPPPKQEGVVWPGAPDYLYIEVYLDPCHPHDPPPPEAPIGYTFSGVHIVHRTRVTCAPAILPGLAPYKFTFQYALIGSQGDASQQDNSSAQPPIASPVPPATEQEHEAPAAEAAFEVLHLTL